MAGNGHAEQDRFNRQERIKRHEIEEKRTRIIHEESDGIDRQQA